MNNGEQIGQNEERLQELNQAIEDLEAKLEGMNGRLAACDASAARMRRATGGLKKKLIVVTVAMGIVATSFAASTYSYFTDSITSGANKITTGYAAVQLMDVTSSSPDVGDLDPFVPIRILPGYSVNKTVSAKNEGSYPLYLRVKIQPAVVLDERYAGRESEIDLSLITFDIDRENWIERDGYYYYKNALKKNETAPSLMTAVNFSEEMGNLYKDSTLTVNVRLEVVQANNNGANVFEAVGWTAPLEGGAP